MVRSKGKSLGEITATFTVCVLFSVLAGWLCMIFSNSLRPNELLLPVAFTISLALSGFGFFLCITNDSVAMLKIKLRASCIALFCVQFVMSMLWLFIVYRFGFYILGFTWCCIMLSIVAAYIVLSVRMRILSGFMLIFTLLTYAYMAYISIGFVV